MHGPREKVLPFRKPSTDVSLLFTLAVAVNRATRLYDVKMSLFSINSENFIDSLCRLPTASFSEAQGAATWYSQRFSTQMATTWPGLRPVREGCWLPCPGGGAEGAEAAAAAVRPGRARGREPHRRPQGAQGAQRDSAMSPPRGRRHTWMV